jgi:serine/threonine protein kinase
MNADHTDLTGFSGLLAPCPGDGYTLYMPPTRISRYEVIAELGRGGMATVFRAYDPSFDREVAVKVLPREFLHDPQFRERFQREIKTIAQLEHPAIVPVYDVGEHDGQPFFVMRYMTGGSLSEWIKQRKFSLEDTARIIERLADALEYAHAKGIIHRDLKPDNILFDHNGAPFITDFGVAKLEQVASTLTGSGVIGTPAYMSPEQAQSGQIDTRSDIYGLGVILFEILTGKQPYEADTPMGVIVKHITEPVPDILEVNPGLSREVGAIVQKALAKKKEQRYGTAGEMARALNLAVFGSDSSQFSPLATLPGKAPEVPSKPRWPVLAGGIILLAAIATAVLFLNSPFNSTPPATSIPGESPGEVAITGPSQTLEAPTTAASLDTADKIAFLSGKEIWLMNMDGSDALPITNSGSGKSNLQWMNNGKSILYLAGTCAYTLDTETNQVETIVCFSPAKYLDGFRVSPDGASVAISLNRELFVVPFDREKLRKVQNKSDLLAMEGSCLYNQAAIKDIRWSGDGRQLAVTYLDTSSRFVDRVRLLDLSACPPATVVVVTEFPQGDFALEGYKDYPDIPSIDWDGDQLLLFNDTIQNEGFGNLYLYDRTSQTVQMINPVEGACCYRDARWSPDGQHVLFLFQNSVAAGSPTNRFYYVTYSELLSGQVGSPFEFPFQVLTSPSEKPQPAIRAVQ